MKSYPNLNRMTNFMNLFDASLFIKISPKACMNIIIKNLSLSHVTLVEWLSRLCIIIQWKSLDDEITLRFEQKKS